MSLSEKDQPVGTPARGGSRGGRLGLIGLTVILSLGASRPLRAQSNDTKMAAEALFDEGKKKLANKDIAGACQDFQKSQELDPGLGGLLYLADCTEKLGRTASAWGMYREAISLAKTAGQADLEGLASRRSQALAPRLVKVKVQVPAESVPGLAVTRDREPVPRVLWGTELPVDPGYHEYAASAPGKRTWTLSVTVKEGDAPHLIEVPTLEDAPPGEPASSASSAAPAASSAPASPVAPPPPAAPAWRMPLLIGFGGLFVGGVVVGSIFGQRARSQNKDAALHCRPEAPAQCDATGASLGDDARRSAAASTISFAVGGAGLVGGLIVLLLPTPSPPVEVGKMRWQAGPGPGQIGLSVDGAW